MVVGLALRRIDARSQLSDATSRVLVTKRWKTDITDMVRRPKYRNGAARRGYALFCSLAVVVGRLAEIFYFGKKIRRSAGRRCKVPVDLIAHTHAIHVEIILM